MVGGVATDMGCGAGLGLVTTRLMGRIFRDSVVLGEMRQLLTQRTRDGITARTTRRPTTSLQTLSQNRRQGWGLAGQEGYRTAKRAGKTRQSFTVACETGQLKGNFG